MTTRAALRKKNVPPVTSQRLRVRRFLRDTFIFVLISALLFAALSFTMPTIGPATYVASGGTPATAELPFFIPSIASTISLSVPIDLSFIHPHVFSVQVDDCLEHMTVNRQTVIPDHQKTFCSPHDKTRINLGRWLVPGRNTLAMKISDIGVTEGIAIDVSPSDPLVLFITIVFLILIGWYTWRIRALFPRQRMLSILLTVLFIGIIIRLLYVEGTAYDIRTHDLDGHLEYINFIRTHGHLPMASDGWEFHQAPLYYAFSAAWMELCSRFFGLTQSMLFHSLQVWALVFSVLTLAVTLVATPLLFSSRDRYGVMLFGLLLCVFPGIVFFSSRITNETLSLLLTMSCIVLLLQWWRNPRYRWIVGTGILFSLSMVTKVSVLVLLPGILLPLLLRKASLGHRVLRVALFCTIVIALAGWYPALRLLVEPNHSKTLSLGNDQMNPSLAVPRDVRHLFTFNPIALARQPFNDPWDDNARRGNLLEYFFRSSLFGEFKFEKLLWIAYPLIVSALLLLPWLLYGFVRELRFSFYRLLPLHFVTACLLLGAFLYPYLFAYASNQDFRFSAALALPCAFYLIRGISQLPVLLREIALGILMTFIVCSSVFVVVLFVQA